MKHRSFSNWLSSFRKSINSYNYYTDFNKVYQNAEKFKIEIHILNSLIGSKNIDYEFEQLLSEYPNCLKVIPLLLAVRNFELYCQDEQGSVIYNFHSMKHPASQYSYFMRKTGLFNLLESHIISNLYDYITGIEVGLDSNGRKNRGGHQMENLVEYYIKSTGVEYYSQMDLSKVEAKWNVDLSSISANGTSTKTWDFVVRTSSYIYLIETNFYSSEGSKLNETARSYKMIAEEAKNISNIRFIWITDGAGWLKAKNNLKETFDVLDTLYNITDLESGVLNTLFHLDFPNAIQSSNLHSLPQSHSF